jgi:hypothetical protein
MGQSLRWRVAALLCCLCVSSTRLHAALVTDASALAPPTKVITFEQFAGLGYNFTAGPVDVGGLVGETVIFTMSNPAASNSGLGAVLGSGGYGLLGNGFWDDPKTYAGLDAPNSAYMEFAFANPVSGVGGFINYATDFGSMIIEVLDASDNVLESYDLTVDAPISTPGGYNDGAFRGIVRGTADIAKFRLYNSYVVIDDLTFTSGVIPEPSTVVLAGIGIGLLGLRSWRKRIAR